MNTVTMPSPPWRLVPLGRAGRRTSALRALVAAAVPTLGLGAGIGIAAQGARNMLGGDQASARLAQRQLSR